MFSHKPAPKRQRGQSGAPRRWNTVFEQLNDSREAMAFKCAHLFMLHWSKWVAATRHEARRQSQHAFTETSHALRTGSRTWENASQHVKSCRHARASVKNDSCEKAVQVLSKIENESRERNKQVT
ncbi:uncharacterized [Tachysurus ichikawai]